MGKLQVNTAICDMLKTTLEDLQKYECVNVNTALLLVSKSSKKLLATGLININMAKMIELDDECEVCSINGGLTIGPDSVAPSKLTLLNVNGGLIIYPGSRKAIEGYSHIIVNGGLVLPNSIPMSSITVNGGVTRYPDEAVLLEDLVINDSFINTTKPETLFFVEGSLQDLNCNPAPLLEKKVSIIVSNVVVYEEYEATLSSIVQGRQNWECIPSGFAYIHGVDLDYDVVYQYGKNLYISGDLYVSRENAHVLDSLDTLIVTGQSIIPASSIDKFKERCKKTTSMLTYKGEGWRISENSETLTKELLNDMPDGVTIFLSTSELIIASDISGEDILGKVHAIHGVDSTIAIEQHHKIPLRKKVKGSVILNMHSEQQEEKEIPTEEEMLTKENCTQINSAYHKL